MRCLSDSFGRDRSRAGTKGLSTTLRINAIIIEVTNGHKDGTCRESRKILRVIDVTTSGIATRVTLGPIWTRCINSDLPRGSRSLIRTDRTSGVIATVGTMTNSLFQFKPYAVA